MDFANMTESEKEVIITYMLENENLSPGYRELIMFIKKKLNDEHGNLKRDFLLGTMNEDSILNKKLISIPLKDAMLIVQTLSFFIIGDDMLFFKAERDAIHRLVDFAMEGIENARL